MKPIEGVIQIKTSNPNNGGHGHWAVQARKRKTERALALVATAPLRLTLEPIIRITLTRLSRAVRMDPDGLVSSLKSIQDGVAARLRIDDGSPLVEWVYRQEDGEPGVRYRIEPLVTSSSPPQAGCYCPPDDGGCSCPEARGR
jgi:hypothetical protein